MELTIKDVEYTANLAKLELNEAEQENMLEDLKAILEYAAQLNEADIENVEPLTHVAENVNAYREDVIGETLSIDETLLNAPESEDRYFKVPKVL